MQTLRNTWLIYKKQPKDKNIKERDRYFHWKFTNLHVIVPEFTTNLSYSNLTEDQMSIIKSSDRKTKYDNQDIIFLRKAYSSYDPAFQMAKLPKKKWNMLKELFLERKNKESIDKVSQMQMFSGNGNFLIVECINNYLKDDKKKKLKELSDDLMEKKKKLDFIDYILQEKLFFKSSFDNFTELFEFDKADDVKRNLAFTKEVFIKSFNFYQQTVKKDKQILKNYFESLKEISISVISTQEITEEFPIFKIEDNFAIFCKCDLQNFSHYFHKMKVKVIPKLLIWDTPYNLFKDTSYDSRLSNEDYLIIFKQISNLVDLKECFFWLILFYHSKDFERISTGLIKSELIKNDSQIFERIFIYSNKRKHITSGGTNSFFKNHENYLVIGCGNEKLTNKKNNNIRQNSVCEASTCHIKSKNSKGEIVNKGEKGAHFNGVYHHLITQFTEENDLILDLGSGTGSGALSSLTLKRNCISFEKNEDQFKFSIAKFENRLDEVKKDFKKSSQKISNTKIEDIDEVIETGIEINKNLEEKIDKSNQKEQVKENQNQNENLQKETEKEEESKKSTVINCIDCKNIIEEFELCVGCKSHVCKLKSKKGKKYYYSCLRKFDSKYFCQNCGPCSMSECNGIFTRIDFVLCEGSLNNSICGSKCCSSHEKNFLGSKFYCDNCIKE